MVSKAVYQDQAIDFLESALRDHNLKSMVRSQNGDCHFLLAEELEGSRVFLAFRGTEDKKDLTEDLKIYQVISSIVTTEILIEREKRPKEQFPGEVINITFGSPLFGDDTARRFLEEKNFSAKMFHFVAELDPVPSLLSFAQSISAVKKPGCLRLKISIIPYQDIN